MKNEITILVTNWFSADLIGGLIENLRNKATDADSLKFLIVDNTDGKDKEIYSIPRPSNSVIMKNSPGALKNLSAHASGINYGFSQIDTEFVLIVDPDVNIFKQDWDTFLVNQLNKKDIGCIGTAYPSWWLGTYHNFPSPVFCFAKTSSLTKINPNWMPKKVNILIKIRNLILRQLLRGCFLFNRRQLQKSPLIRDFTLKLEHLFPTCSIDTGYNIAQSERKGDIKAEVFNAIYHEELNSMKNIMDVSQKSYIELATQYELYSYESEIILTHQYGSQNFLLKTEKGLDRQYWKELIQKIEKPTVSSNLKKL